MIISELKHQIACIIREMSVEPEEQCDKIADEVMGLLNTRPKPSVKWPEKKKCPVKYPATSEFINGELHGFNKAIDACQAAIGKEPA